jgi:hypothetical protein
MTLDFRLIFGLEKSFAFKNFIRYNLDDGFLIGQENHQLKYTIGKSQILIP